MLLRGKRVLRNLRVSHKEDERLALPQATNLPAQAAVEFNFEKIPLSATAEMAKRH